MTDSKKIDDGGRDLTSIIEQLEKAECPDRGLDAAIFNAFPPVSDAPYLPEFSSSFDAAVSLAERLVPGCFYLASKGKTRHDEPLYAAQILFGTDQVLGEGESDASLAVAICLATLRALQSKGAA